MVRLLGFPFLMFPGDHMVCGTTVKANLEASLMGWMIEFASSCTLVILAEAPPSTFC